MAVTHKNRCVLCGNLCGLEIQVENNRIVKVRSDKENPRSQGYICRKGRNIAYYQHNEARLTHPLKKVGNKFEQITWDQAIDEIGDKLSSILDEHGPKSLAMMGAGILAATTQGGFGVGLLRILGSHYYYNAIAQELTGRFWADGRAFGRQYLHTTADEPNTDMLLIVGKNPLQSHHFQRSRVVLKKYSKDPDKILVVVDPRRTQTAKLADIHLVIRPGTDALFYRAMISIILKEGWENQDYINRHVTGFDSIRSWFTEFDAEAALKVCELDYKQVKEVCRLLATRKSSHESDLGVLMTRHSTLISYLENVLRSICGRIGVPGGNVFPGSLGGGGGHSDERDPKTWRTMATDFPAICGIFPPNAMPEEISTDHPERLRAVFVSATNPLRSFADTSAYEEAFKKLDLLVTIDIVMNETAALSDYVLPSASCYESWDMGGAGGYPKIYSQISPPIIEPEGEQIEPGEIFTRLADKMGLIPDIPESLYTAAATGERLTFGAALMEYIKENPESRSRINYIVGKTLGKELGSQHLAAMWSRMMILPEEAHKKAARVGFKPGMTLGDDIFQALLDNPQGLWVGEVDPSENLQMIKTEDGKINLIVPEMEEWIKEIDPASELEKLNNDSANYPFILKAGNHIDTNANTQMRVPEWNEGKRACTLTMHPDDANSEGFQDGDLVKVVTETGEETIELEVTEAEKTGHVTMPHGFGLVYQEKVFGPNVNRLTKNTHRDRLAATPLHSYVLCKVKKAS